MVGVHEATVSRVTRNRYVQTPRGVFELKYFFNSGISTESGGMASSVSVKEMIESMINKEDSQNPLSDKDIEVQLKQNGIRIARRTIAKYRGELNIPPSSKRKQW
jgi:RNA polymerase sigma-54 factor